MTKTDRWYTDKDLDGELEPADLTEEEPASPAGGGAAPGPTVRVVISPLRGKMGDKYYYSPEDGTVRSKSTTETEETAKTTEFRIKKGKLLGKFGDLTFTAEEKTEVGSGDIPGSGSGGKSGGDSGDDLGPASSFTTVTDGEPPKTKKKKAARTHRGPELSININERTVKNRGKKKRLLRDIRMVIPGGSMVLILGGSGAGKTTFMNAVMGYEKADATILYNGMNMYTDYDRMMYEIGYVPQGHLLRDNDTVYSTLKNAALMRMPRGLSNEEYERKVESTLNLFGLSKEKNSLVKKLSGGQEKRLSLGEQYIGNPSLFFLDEPDSGLDGPNTKTIMKNLRSIADEGKIIMVISHSPDRVFDLFDYVVVLAKDQRENCGRLVYFGSPEDAKTFEGGEGRADEFIDHFERIR